MEVNPALWIPAFLVGVLVVLVVMALVLNKPHLILFLFVVSLPLEIIAVEEDIFSISKILGLLALVSWLISCIKDKNKIHIDKAATCLFIFVIFGCISYFWSVNQHETLVFISTYSLLLILYLLTINMITSVKTINLMMIALLTCGLLILLYWLFAIDSGMIRADKRFSGTAGINGTALWIIAILPCFYYIYRTYQSTLLRMLILCILAGLLCVLVLTESRGGLISLFTFLAIPFLFKIGKPKILLIVVTVCAVIYLTAPDKFWLRFETIGNEGKTDRIGALWPAGLQVAVRSPIIGYGLGTNAEVIQPLTGLGGGYFHNLPVHCGPLAVAIELGGVGLIFYMLFLFLPIKEVIHRLRFSKEFDKSKDVRYTLNVLLLSAFGAIIVSWVKGGGMEYSKILFFYLGLVASTSKVCFSKVCNNNTCNKEKVIPVGMQLRQSVIRR